jgi:CBS domain-containing protein
MKTDHWMKPDAVSIQSGSTVEAAAFKMSKLAVHHLIVLDGEKYCGMLDARDLAGVWDRQMLVEKLVQTDVPMVDSFTDIKTVVELMVNHGFTAVALKRGQHVSGVITVTDLVRLLAAKFSHPAGFSELVDKGKTFLSTPLLQELSRLLGAAGI